MILETERLGIRYFKPADSSDAYCNPLNERSWRLLERLSFRREGTMIQNRSFHADDHGNPIWQDTYAYGLLKEEWRI
jgi:[ribosomal protein S5]-alanine N-acetyltransferase